MTIVSIKEARSKIGHLIERAEQGRGNRHHAARKRGRYDSRHCPFETEAYAARRIQENNKCGRNADE
jgi:hypothetical protein